jgi:hypothetical protein
MRKNLIPLLAAVALLLAAAPGFATTPAADALLLCPATATAEGPELLPAEEVEVEEALLPEEALVPDPVPAWCPYNRPCTFFCPDYQDCPPPECIGGVCVYGW